MILFRRATCCAILLLFIAALVTRAGSAPPPIVPNQPLTLRPAPKSADVEPARFAGMLAAHNRARRAVGVPDLQWSGELTSIAQAWAERLRVEHCVMRHSGAHGIGENLTWAARQHLSPAAVVATWVQEAGSFNPADGSCAPGAVCGHYTQVVWRNTRTVGCGMVSCGDSEVWVCNYAPPGNYVGERPY